MAKKLKIKAFLERHGLKLCWVAASLGMSEELFRYHIAHGFEHGNIAERFRALIKAHAAAVIEDLPEIPAREQNTSRDTTGAAPR